MAVRLGKRTTKTKRIKGKRGSGLPCDCSGDPMKAAYSALNRLSAAQRKRGFITARRSKKRQKKKEE